MARFRALQPFLQRPFSDPRGPIFSENAPVAQLDRASDYESEGRTFESFRARHFPQKEIAVPAPREKIARGGRYQVIGTQQFIVADFPAAPLVVPRPVHRGKR